MCPRWTVSRDSSKSVQEHNTHGKNTKWWLLKIQQNARVCRPKRPIHGTVSRISLGDIDEIGSRHNTSLQAPVIPCIVPVCGQRFFRHYTGHRYYSEYRTTRYSSVCEPKTPALYRAPGTIQPALHRAQYCTSLYPRNKHAGKCQSTAGAGGSNLCASIHGAPPALSTIDHTPDKGKPCISLIAQSGGLCLSSASRWISAPDKTPDKEKVLQYRLGINHDKVAILRPPKFPSY